MNSVTFIEPASGKPLNKIVHIDRTTSYPLVKKITSHEHTLDNAPSVALNQFSDLLKKHAGKGHAYYRGEFDKPLVKESRKGRSTQNHKHSIMVMDFDKITLTALGLATTHQWNANTMKNVAQQAIRLLPAIFQDVSCIARASSSMGLKDEYSFHLFWLLDKPMAPKLLKNTLQWLNFEVKELEDQITLTPSGGSLSYKLDPCLADNARIVYVAPPTFVAPAADVFANNNERQAVINGQADQINTQALVDQVNFNGLNKQISKKITSLRKSLGLERKKESSTMVRIDNESVRVITNPDMMTVHIIATEGRYLRCNINDGDSGAYYIDKQRPTIVWNFKGDPPFLLEKADNALFDELMHELNNNEVIAGQKDRPYCFRDISTDQMFAGFLNENGELEKLNTIRETSVGDFFKDHGTVKPAVIPQMYYEFRPNDSRTVDFSNRFINRYQPSKYFKQIKDIDPKYHNIKKENFADLEKICPTIYKIIFHVCGSNKTEAAALFRWLAFICKHRVKPRLAWILHGTQGTGKGLLFHFIMTPLLGAQYTSQKNLNDISDAFNDWLGQKLFVMVDEFRLADTGNTGRTVSMLKQAITEPIMTVRGMRQAQRDMHSFTGFIFCSNNDDAMSFPEDDRRFNVATRQETKLFSVYPQLANNAVDLITAELEDFASVIHHCDASIEEISTVLDNKAKRNMYRAAMKTTDQFANALKTGDLDWFVNYYYEKPFTDTEMRAHLDYKKIIESICTELATKTFITNDDVRVLYMRVVGKPITSIALGRFLGLYGMSTSYGTVNGKKARGHKIQFKLFDYPVSQILGESNNLKVVEFQKSDNI